MNKFQTTGPYLKKTFVSNYLDNILQLFKAAAASSSSLDKTTVCHFFTSKSCLEDVHVVKESAEKSHIYVADSCDGDIKVFLFARDERMQLVRRVRVPAGKPVSMLAMPESPHMLLVLTHSPRKIYVFDVRTTCK